MGVETKPLKTNNLLIIKNLNNMNQKIIFRNAAILLLVTGIFSSCKGRMEDEEVTDPETAILGKWELVLLTGGVHEPEKYEPTGYVEYLPDGRFGWYDYTTKEYTLFQEKYWVDTSYGWPEPVHQIEEGWVLHYETSLAEMDNSRGGVDTYTVGPDFLDKPIGFNFQLKFNNQNTKSLYCLDAWSFAGSPDYIYKRKK